MAESEDNPLAQLHQTLASDPTNPENHFNLGLFLWEKEEEEESNGEEESKKLKEKAAESFLAAAKLNPNDERPFVFLGRFYKQVAGDSQRAGKCYQRAVTLNPDDLQAGEGLCDLLDEEGKESLEIAVCKEACEKSRKAYWAFRRLGFFQVHQKKWSEAVPNLQQAIRGFQSCADLWEALGLAYHRLGMLTAALKSYARAIELNESRIFALIESGNIHIILGSFREGVERFRDALKTAPNNLSAQFGFASGLLSWARNCINSGAFIWAATLLQEASEAANTCTGLQGNLFSLWKLQGDIQISYAKCFPWKEEEEEEEEELNEEKFSISVQKWKNERVFAAHRAKKSYQRALHLSPWQSNIYADISISLDLIESLESEAENASASWQLKEKMVLGALLTEPTNKDFWVILGCVSRDFALKQHSFIRALQLDVSLAESWAYLGKMYRELGEKLLARKALDRARSIDPSLALPWAGLSFDNQLGDDSLEESFENCLMAVQILPIAEFQVGLGAIAARSGHLKSPQVLAAIRQAVQRLPNYPESHNIKGLICEARSDYKSAISAYKNAKFALNLITHSDSDIFKSRLASVSINLARSLCKAGLADEAAHECELLKKEGLLGLNELQIHAVSLFNQGQFNPALSIAKTLAGNTAAMNHVNATTVVSLVSKLVYSISGKESLELLVKKIPSMLLESDKMRFVMAALNAVGKNDKLELGDDMACDVAAEIHSIVGLGKLLRDNSKKYLAIDDGVKYLQKALHMYPNSNFLRNQISSLLLSSQDWISHNKANICTSLLKGESVRKTLKSPHGIRGASVVACYASSNVIHKFSFPSCKPHFDRNDDVLHLNRWMHQEPWNQNARYLLLLSLIQKAREENYPNNLCTTLKRLIIRTINWYDSSESETFQYQKFILLLCASEINLQLNDQISAISSISDTLEIPEKYTDSFFAHLQFCRIYGIQGKLTELETEYNKCLEKETNNEIGWILLKYIESKFNLGNSDLIESKLRNCCEGKNKGLNVWVALFYLACAQSFIWDDDYVSAELALGQACEESGRDSCLFLSHGAVCLELAKRQSDPDFISRALSSLRKAQQNSVLQLPFISFLLAKTEASLGSKSKWERNLRLEFSSWPSEMRPAEIYFQMHLLARTTENSVSSRQPGGLESVQRPELWLLRAIHLNPSCLKYWHVLCMQLYP
ncbi:hypothetical protein LUZ60_000078 [Juncus effusus]|nr:hypothetical protein LUZ60_000078 [Juncus effusus]